MTEQSTSPETTTNIEPTASTEQVCTYVVEQFIEHNITEVVGVRFSLEAAQTLGVRAVGSSYAGHGSRDVVWRESTDSTCLDRDTELRTWAAHRTSSYPRPATETYLWVSITEHLVPEDTL